MKRRFPVLAAACVCALALAACSKGPQATRSSEAARAPSSAPPTETAPPASRPAPQPASTEAGKGAGAEQTREHAAGSQEVPKLSSGQNVDVETLPPEMVILTISGTPVTVGEYRRMYKMQQVQLEALAVNNPMVRADLLQQANRMKLTLTQQEKDKLVQAARQSKGKTDAEFQEFLKKNKISEQQFNNEIWEIGTAVKAVGVILQQSLLSDLVNRELLCQAGRKANLEGKAAAKYKEVKSSPDYPQIVKATQLSDADLKEEITKNELSKLMMQSIQKQASVSDADMKQFYNKNRKLLQHKERIRLSEIIVAAPTQDIGPIASIRTQLQKAEPKLSAEELAKKVDQVMALQRQKAEGILALARAGQNFSELANKFTDDAHAKCKKTGGDGDFQDKQQMPPELARAMWPLKAGTVYPGLVQTPIGFVIVKVTAHEGSGTSTLAEVKDQLRVLILQQKQQQRVNDLLRSKRATANLVLAPKFAALLNQQNPSGQTSSLNALPH